MRLSLTDRTAVITGGGSGIGRETAITLANAGASVVVADVDKTGGSETVDQIVDNTSSDAAFVQTDVSDSNEVDTLVDATVERFDSIDIFVNNAGGSFDDDTITRVSDSTLDQIIEVNLKGQFCCARAVIPTMVENGGGALVHISSVNALSGIGLAGYSAAKGGVISLSRVIANQYGQYGIRSNVVCPGTIITDASSEKLTDPSPIRDEWLNQYPVGRFGHPEDVAAAVVYLASDNASFVTGTNLVVDGGLTVGPDQTLERSMYDIDDLNTDS